MLSNLSYLKQTAILSAVETTSYLKPNSTGAGKRNLAADLLLTALIDAFSILVIFLLMSFSSTGDILFINKDTELPKAKSTEVLERNPVVKIENGKMYLEQSEVTADSLVAELLKLKQEYAETHPEQESASRVTIQADRRTPYSTLNSIVLAASHAGFSDVHFAVIVK